MAYVPTHEADVFISYSHEDDFAWIERFTHDLHTILIRKLKARTRPEIFLDAQNLRAGRVFDADIPAALEKTGFFLAMVSPRYNASTYCKQKELTKFLRLHRPESGRLIQLILDLAARLPVDKTLAVPVVDARGPLQPGTDAYTEALRRIYEPIVTELDQLYAASKIVFLAWPDDPGLEKERQNLESELEGRGLRVFPEAIAEFDSDVDVRLRDALELCTTSVHFFRPDPSPFDLRQWDAAVRLGKPCILASRSREEIRRGPAGSPAPIYLDQGNPTKTIASAIEQIAGIGRRDEREVQQALGKTPILLVVNPDSDRPLGLEVGRRIALRGPFEVIAPRNAAGLRYQDLPRAKAALLCRKRAGNDWLAAEYDALNQAAFDANLFGLRRALLVQPPPPDISGLAVIEGDDILDSMQALDGFLDKLQGAAA